MSKKNKPENKRKNLVVLDCAAWLILEKQDWAKVNVFKRGL